MMMRRRSSSSGRAHLEVQVVTAALLLATAAFAAVSGADDDDVQHCGGLNANDDDDVRSIVSEWLFNQMLLHRNDDRCPAKGFYTYDAFIAAAAAFPGFGTTGSLDTRKREIAAFMAQTSHETTGGWDGTPDGRYTWGYCFKEEICGAACPDYCQLSFQWPCVAGKKYYGRGPIQISWNYNYGPAGNHTAIAAGLLADPDLVARDVLVAFKTAIWFWMTPQPPKPSSHDVITGQWTPSAADLAAGRLPGYGVITNIINGGLECGNGQNQFADDRVGFYKHYCDMLGVSYGDNLDCNNQKPFGTTISSPSAAAAAAI